ncbi:MAG: hypothetical protein EHM28_01050 [Spirochaetaceae bacterium]|nr:MAG: hypothetical protein EHM28_01050 [Spirochaetaceae bacterium]
MDENLQLESTDKARRGPIKPLLLQIRGEPSEHDPSISVPIMYFIGEGQKRKNTKEDLKAAVIKALGLTALTKADLEMALENMGFQAVKRQLNDLLPRMAKEHRVKTQKIEGHGNKKFWSVL